MNLLIGLMQMSSLNRGVRYAPMSAAGRVVYAICLAVTFLANALLDSYLAMRVYSAYDLYNAQHVIGSLRLTFMIIVTVVLALAGLATVVPYFARRWRRYGLAAYYVPASVAVVWVMVGGMLSMALGI